MRKLIVSFLLLMFALLLGGCAENAVLDEMRSYSVGSNIHSLDIRIGAAEFTIKQADTFSAESNLKYLTVSEKNGVLSIVEDAKRGVEYEGPILTLYMPTDRMYDSIDISTGAGVLTADTLSAKSLEFELGAGDVNIANLIVESEADIKGGAGQITIADGSIRDLELEMGVGELNLTAALLGDSDLSFGVGESNLALLGDTEDYRIEMEKGIGSIAIDGRGISDSGRFGNGQNSVEIQGGVGSINLTFQKSA